MNRAISACAIALASLALTACATPGKQKTLEDTLRQYEAVIRWSQWDGAVNFMAPEYLAEHPISDLDMRRLRLFQVTQYTLRSSTPTADGNELVQVVEIRLFNKTQAIERAILNRQVWRYDEASKHWWLYSDLPDVTQGR